MDINEMIFKAVQSICDVMGAIADDLNSDDMDKLMEQKNAVDNCIKAIRLLERNYE